MLAELLTRQFRIPALERYAAEYRRFLVEPIIKSVLGHLIAEREILCLLDEPEAVADVVHQHQDELRSKGFILLIEKCRPFWPPPTNTAA